MKQFTAKMAKVLKPGKTAKGISLTVLELADDALDGVPIPGAKAGIGAVLGVAKGIDKTSHNSKMLAELEEHIRFLTELLEPLTKIDRHNLSSGLKDDVRKLNTKLESIASNVKSRSSAGAVNRYFRREDDENDMRTFVSEMKAALDRFHVSQGLRQEQEFLLRERSALAMSLPRADYAAYDSGREDAPLSCLPGTRVAILDEVMSWLESTEHGTPPVFWLNGLAGIGKSTIAKTTAEEADKKGMLGGSFFFSESDEPLRNPRLVFPTLAFQLTQSDNAFKNVIGEAIQQDATLGHKDLWPQLEGLLLKPLHKLGSNRGTTLIILDALDSCEEKGAATILQLLLSHASRVPFLRILITSRPEGHISSVFNEARNHKKRILHDIEASVIQGDLRLYIRSELANIPKKLNVRLAADWTTDEEINALVEKSGKLFVYAATSIRFIGDDRVRKPRRHLGIILSTQTTQKAGATPYSHLDNLYSGVLRNSLSKSNRQDVLNDFQVVVGSIVLLREPLPLRSLAQFVQYEIDEVDSALYHLRSVIIPPSTDREAPRIYHPSFRDFIMDASRCSEADFLIMPVPEQERRHAIRCFDLMAASLKRDVIGISNPSLLNSEVDRFEEKVRDALSPEVQYACRYWASHLSHVELGDKTTMQALEAFSKRSILMWLEAMSLIGSISDSVGSIQEAHHWAASSKCNSTVVTILSDTNRFILAHAGVIRANALQLYHSALAFTPHDTTLYKTYSQDVNCSIGVLQGVESQWQRNLSTLVGHSDSVTSVAFSPDGLRLASGSDDYNLRLWDAMSGAQIAILTGHLDSVTSVAFSPDGLRLASGSHDFDLQLWDGMSGSHIATLEGHSGSVRSVAFSPDGSRLVSGSDDRTLLVWNGTSGERLASLEGHSGSVRSIAFSRDGTRLASGSDDRSLRLWDGMSGAHITTVEAHSRSVRSVVFSPDGLQLASGSDDCTLQLWEAASGKHITTYQGHSLSVRSVAFSPDGLQLASGSDDDTLRLWEAKSGTHITSLKGHSGSVRSIAFSPDGSRLASGSNDHTLRLWDAVSGESGEQVTTLETHSHLVKSIAFSPDGLRLASGSDDHTLRLWDVIPDGHIATLEAHSDSITSIAFSPDGLRLASGSDDRTLQLWDRMSGKHIASLEGHSDSITSIAFSPDGLRLVSGSDDDTLQLWDGMSGEHITSLEGHSDSITSIAFSPDGLRLASGSRDDTLQLWDVTSGAPIATLEEHSDWVRSVAFSPDGLQLASGSDDYTVRLWDGMSGAQIACLEGHSDFVTSVAFSIDNHTLTLVSRTDAETFTWDLTSEPPHRLDSGSLPVAFLPIVGLSSLIWSLDGPWIQARHPQDTHTTRICYIPTHYAPSTTVEASSVSTQSHVAVGCADGRVIILDIQHHPFVHKLRKIATPS